MSDAVFVVEFRSISHGIGMLDRMLKRSGVTLLYAGPICIGKYLICLGGDVADAAEAKKVTEDPAETRPMASRLITGTHPSILSYFRGGAPQSMDPPPAIGVVETRNASSGFISLDRAQKGARTHLLRIWLGNRLGGKLCYVLGGETSDVQSAIRAAAAAAGERELVGTRLILSPDPETIALFVKGGGQHEPAGTDF